MIQIEVDFNNCDSQGRIRLNTAGAIASLRGAHCDLQNGLEVQLVCGDFVPIRGVAEYSDSERIWVARFDLNDLRRATTG